MKKTIKFKLDQDVALGQGVYGSVFSGTWENEMKRQLSVAVKRVELAKMQNLLHKERNLKKLDHNNIVKLYDVLDDENYR